MPDRAYAATSSLRAQRSNPESPRGSSLDCFAALAMTGMHPAFQSRLPMMPLYPCFARRSKSTSPNPQFNDTRRQVVDSAGPGYCAWGCFRIFVLRPTTPPLSPSAAAHRR
ncbi:hypothetical protein EOW77_0027845 [Bradyrhizobium yuanmingense]|nr:hypothetical protein EOW77_0027845 [Bradyrhizobium yuanmingense]